jgi:hypothetical protein
MFVQNNIWKFISPGAFLSTNVNPFSFWWFVLTLVEIDQLVLEKMKMWKVKTNDGQEKVYLRSNKLRWAKISLIILSLMHC